MQRREQPIDQLEPGRRRQPKRAADSDDAPYPRRMMAGQRPGEHAAETLPDEAGALPIPIRDLLQQCFYRIDAAVGPRLIPASQPTVG
jgi:hypothetical protein